MARPLTTVLVTEGGFNDRGVRLLGNNGTVNVHAYALHGSGEGRRFGGRLGFTPFGVPFALKERRDPKQVELGVSAFTQRAPGGREAERAFALDLELNLGPFTLLAEHLDRRRRPAEGPTHAHRGWHLTPHWAFGEDGLKVFARYEKVWGGTAEGADTAPATRFSAGLSTTLWGTLQAKLEFQRSVRTPTALAGDPTFQGSRVLLQLVVVL